MPPLADGADRHERVLRRPRLVVVRVVAEHVRGRIHEPREVENDAVSQGAGHPETVPKLFSPRVLRHQRRENEAHEKSKPGV